MQSFHSSPSFPPINSCPSDSDMNLDYYTTRDGRSYTPSRHWCLLGEIVHVAFFIRLRLFVRDKEGHGMTVKFYLENDDEVAVEQYKVGHTIAILYPHKHHFPEDIVGVRVELISSVQVRSSLS